MQVMKTQTAEEAIKTEINKPVEAVKKKILVVDDHPVTRRGIARVVSQEKDLMIAGEAEDSEQAMAAIRTCEPDMVIADISLKGSNGLELTRIIKENYPALPVLIQSVNEETLYGQRALQAGALGYVMKNAPAEDLILAIRRVLSGQIYISEQLAARLMQKAVGSTSSLSASPPDCLSGRELQVFLRIGRGQSTRQIAEELGLSVKTIETYRAHLKEKLGPANAGELRRYAIEWVACHDERQSGCNIS